jgi:hypothetical protein
METITTLFTGMSIVIGIWAVVWLKVMVWHEVRGAGGTVKGG